MGKASQSRKGRKSAGAAVQIQKAASTTAGNGKQKDSSSSSPSLKLPSSSSPEDAAKRALIDSLLNESPDPGLIASSVTALSGLAQRLDVNEAFFIDAVPAFVKSLEKKNEKINPKTRLAFLSVLQDLTSSSKSFSAHFLNAAGHVSLISPLPLALKSADNSQASQEAALASLQIILHLIEEFHQGIGRKHLPEKAGMAKELQRLLQEGSFSSSESVKITLLVRMILQELSVPQTFPAELVKQGFAYGEKDSAVLEMTMSLLARYLEESEDDEEKEEQVKDKKSKSSEAGIGTPMEVDDNDEDEADGNGNGTEMEDQDETSSNLQELAPFFEPVLTLVLNPAEQLLDKSLNLLSLFFQRGIVNISDLQSSKLTLLLENLLRFLQSLSASSSSTALRCLLPLLKKNSTASPELSLLAPKLEELFFLSTEEDVKVNLARSISDILFSRKDFEPLGLFFLKALSSFEKNTFYLNCELLDGLMDAFSEDEALPFLQKTGLLKRLKGVRGDLRKSGRGWRAEILEEERVAVVETVFENIGGFVAWAEKGCGSSSSK